MRKNKPSLKRRPVNNGTRRRQLVKRLHQKLLQRRQKFQQQLDEASWAEAS